MDEALKAKLDQARKGMNSQQAGINANRKDDGPAMREWARGKQRPANAERAQFRNSLTDEDRSQIERTHRATGTRSSDIISHERSGIGFEDRAALCFRRTA